MIGSGYFSTRNTRKYSVDDFVAKKRREIQTMQKNQRVRLFYEQTSYMVYFL